MSRCEAEPSPPAKAQPEPACEGVSLSRCEAQPSPMRRRSLSPYAKAQPERACERSEPACEATAEPARVTFQPISHSRYQIRCDGERCRVSTVRTVGPTADTEDVALAVAGDAEAFERVYRRHVTRIHTLCRRMVGESEAEQVTQDVFVRAWEKLDRFGGKSAFGTWLYRLAINVCLGERERSSKRAFRFGGDEAVVERTAGRRSHPEERMDLMRAIDRLPAGAKEVFVLHDVEGYKHREIAELLGVAVGTSKSQLHEARMSLRSFLRG
jgi:RNA polymerase sigma-70 factor, ECF subfamily